MLLLLLSPKKLKNLSVSFSLRFSSARSESRHQLLARGVYVDYSFSSMAAPEQRKLKGFLLCVAPEVGDHPVASVISGHYRLRGAVSASGLTSIPTRCKWRSIRARGGCTTAM